MIDTRIGNPEFMKPYWQASEETFPGLNVPVSRGMRYDRSPEERQLKEEIVRIHQNIKNVANPGSYEIVIGCGATQLLAAALYTAKRSGIDEVYARPPYYFRFPFMADAAGLTLTGSGIGIRARPHAEIITVPSNPDNVVYEQSDLAFPIFDLCYNWPQYGQVIARDDDLMIYGMSKATGHSSCRIGWALVKDKSVAEQMRFYIEIASGGSSIESLIHAKMILSDQSHLYDEGSETDSVFEYGKEILNDRWEQIKALDVPCLEVLNTSGMFLWATYKDGMASLRQDTQIHGTDGSLCGGSSKHVRISIGGSNENFREVINSFKGLE